MPLPAKNLSARQQHWCASAPRETSSPFLVKSERCSRATWPERLFGAARRTLGVAVLLVSMNACAARVGVLPGSEYSGALPSTAVAGRRTLHFQWQYWDQNRSYKGAGRII